MPVLRRTTKSAMDDRDPDWTSRRGVSRVWMTWDGNKVRVHPFIEGTAAEVGFLETPAPMDATGGPFEPDERLPLEKQKYLPWAAAAYLLSLDTTRKDLVKAQALLEQFDSFVGGSNVRG